MILGIFKLYGTWLMTKER